MFDDSIHQDLINIEEEDNAENEAALQMFDHFQLLQTYEGEKMLILLIRYVFGISMHLSVTTNHVKIVCSPKEVPESFLKEDKMDGELHQMFKKFKAKSQTLSGLYNPTPEKLRII